MPPNLRVLQNQHIWNDFQLITFYISAGVPARNGPPCRAEFLQPSGLRLGLSCFYF